jgi:glycerol-3-phosphate dehydrogenase
MKMLEKPVVQSATDRHALPGTPTVVFDAWYADACARLKALDIDDEAAHWLALRHGTGVERIIEIVREEPESAQRLHSQAPFLVAEAMLAVTDEMARSVDDVLRRRMPMQLLVSAAQLAREQVDARVQALFDQLS